MAKKHVICVQNYMKKYFPLVRFTDKRKDTIDGPDGWP